MRAMVLSAPKTPLQLQERADPIPGDGQIRVKVSACGVCRLCKEGMENLCDRPLFTGYTRDGGCATHTIADARFAFPLGEDGDEGRLNHRGGIPFAVPHARSVSHA